MMEIDITKCLACRKGISCWIIENDKINHLDMFATAEAGAMYECITPDIKNYIHENIRDGQKTGIYLPNAEYKEFFINQEIWWEEVLSIAYKVFLDDTEKVAEFFNAGEKGNMMWNQPNDIILKELLKTAKENKIELNQEDYNIIN